MFTHLTLTNFTAFEHLEMEFSKGVNVFVGANGTGKTHILKLLYCLQMSGTVTGNLSRKFYTVFRTKTGDYKGLIRNSTDRAETKATAIWDDSLMEVSFRAGGVGRSLKNMYQGREITISDVFGVPAYLPVKEMLSFAPGFISLYDKYNLSFDEVYYDILKLAYLPPVKNLDPAFRDISLYIQGIIGGEVVVEGETFYLYQNSISMEFSLVSEGFRKLALVWQLIRNGSLCKETTLYWDEPEANLNPSMMQHVAKILLMLARQGVQIFLATHDYALLKELDYQKEQTPVTYFALDDSGKNGVQVNACSEYIQVYPNKIAEENQRLYDMEIRKSLAGNPR
ncbi:MAG: AAA family ATPase [Magnetococcales bacterium]|nr:AAA family ATPase [Magnetococcales bacterium]